MAPPRLELEHVTKRFASVVANDDVALTVQPGEIHAVLGENGAGKSTLMKIIYGALLPDAGELRWNGTPVEIRSPHEARALGIAMVFQHFSLFDTLTVAENVWLGLDRKVTLRSVAEGIRAKAAEYGLELEPEKPVHVLSVGERQRVEIVRALLANPQLLILDEPTSVLTPQAVEKLFETLRKLAATGCSILYISHKLDEIRSLCHQCTVLRGGKVTGRCDPTLETTASLSRLMIGSDPPRLPPRTGTAGDVALRVRDLTLPRFDRFAVALEGISLDVRAGEIVGIAGVSGNGQQELLAALSGEDPRADAGAVSLFGRGIGRMGAAHRRRLGLHFIPEERLGRGAVPSLSLASNLLLTRKEALRALGWIDRRALRAQASSIIGRYRVKSSGPGAVAKSLSGGNLQKYIVGRELDALPKVLLVAQPTWGVDVGAAAQIRAELIALRDAGCAVLVVSEELEELFAITDRLHVIARGRLSPSIPTSEATVEQVGEWMSGLWNAPAAAAGEAR
ncbi:ABC transporter ATP-binding protein [Anaeromyxobacter oryzae]|uniref:ABC transporter ATP-binding protein n=1 Tax=Anaeromyxobacter oryzae TaxID=2918170 RepID=A0ABM7WP95_9BACT|nr:ABC transporter ATP-binding protein [Anaeromyxobacter oryzae]BDG01278.1 ABC transporter ATP-binding protein [Anaeromyxobacter oryzae]